MPGHALWRKREKKLDVVEIMLRWMTEVTKLSPSWAELLMKEIEGQRRWEKYPRKCRKVGWSGMDIHAFRREEEYVGKRVMAMEVPGKRTRGRPKWIKSKTTCRRESCQWRKHARQSLMETYHEKYRSRTKISKASWRRRLVFTYSSVYHY